ncbi:hypothetical protein QC763_0017470 [Podospora pseudopauciseta]|uniref:Uncharacterized protein n=1 Tax=Podospora pseudopauciseta TaxID=2093780 RepID=A0ABR0I1C2_9PEZI|nr:hypothetical protein QC763_0017470 [Podospora pseudopauciseta]
MNEPKTRLITLKLVVSQAQRQGKQLIPRGWPTGPPVSATTATTLCFHSRSIISVLNTGPGPVGFFSGFPPPFTSSVAHTIDHFHFPLFFCGKSGDIRNFGSFKFSTHS